MTIPSTSRKAGPLLGTGAQTAWPFTFKVFAESDIAVAIATSLGVETPLVLNTDYSVTLNANQETSPGGTVTYPISGTPLPVGSKLSIIGNLAYDQPLDLPSGGNFSPLALENELDRLTMQIQQVKETAGRALLVPVTSTASSALPAPEANKLIAWNETASALQNLSPSQIASVVAYGTAASDIFTGTGAQTAFVLSNNPGALNNLDVAIGGVTQLPGVDYTWTSGTTVTFTAAPPLGAKVLIRYMQALALGTADAGSVQYTPAGTGALATTVQAKLRESVSVKDFGAKGDGVTNDTDAFIAASAYITAQDGGKLIVPAGTYIVGKQTFAGATGKGYAYKGSDIITIQNCTQPVVLEFQGATLKMFSGFKFGSFNPVTGAAYYPPSLPFTNYDYQASLGVMVKLYNNATVSVIGSVELDGNNTNVTLGGQWGDTGYQIVSYGVWAYNNNLCSLENVWSHHHCLDGMASGYDGIITEAGVANPLTIINCVFENNARQGWSVTGGRGITAINCKFNNTGKNTPFVSSPGAGVDLEAEGGWIRDVLFLDCEFSNNAGLGLGADSGNTAGVTLIRCRIIGTTYFAVLPRKPRMTFHDCLIVGCAFNAYDSATQPDDATKFFNCKFSDQVIYSPTGVVYNAGFLAVFEAGANVLLENCNFTATVQRNLSIKSGGYVRNCTFVCQAPLINQDAIALIWNSTIENLTILDQIATPAADGYFVSFSNTKYKGVNYISGTKIKWWSWSSGAGGASGYLGQNNPGEVAYPYLSVIKGGGSPFLGYYGTADTYWGTAAPVSGTYKQGDRFFNGSATVGQPKSWVCTVAGTPGTWVSEGNL